MTRKATCYVNVDWVCNEAASINYSHIELNIVITNYVANNFYFVLSLCAQPCVLTRSFHRHTTIDFFSPYQKSSFPLLKLDCHTKSRHIHVNLTRDKKLFMRQQWKLRACRWKLWSQTQNFQDQETISCAQWLGSFS